MIFTSFDYAIFLIILFVVYWIAGRKEIQNPILLIASYTFYGWITPWFCILLASSSIADYFVGRGMERYPQKKKMFLVFSIVSNLTFLGFFKYFNFFIENVQAALASINVNPD